MLRVRDPVTGLDHALVVEIQLAIDEAKHRRWPLYVCGLRDRLECPVTLVVVTLDPAVARWARQPIELDRIGSRVCALVIGPEDIPPFVARADADRLPELALVTLLAHRDAPASLELGRTVLRCCESLDALRASLYTDLVFAFLNPAARGVLEAEMQLDDYEFQSDFVRGLIARGREEGREEGRGEGEAAGLQRAILAVLAARELAADEDVRARVLGCSDIAKLHTWLVLAATAASSDAIG